MVDEKELQEKEYYRRRLAQWRELGFDTRELEAILETDFEHFKNMSMEKLKQQLHLMSSEESIPKSKAPPSVRNMPRNDRLERPIITEYDDIRKQNQDEKEDELFEIRREMLKRRRFEGTGVRDLEEDSEFTSSRDRRPAQIRERSAQKEPQIDEDYPLISFHSPIDTRPSKGILSQKGQTPQNETHKELSLLEEEAALIKRKRWLLEEDEARLRRKRKLLLGAAGAEDKSGLNGQTEEDTPEDEPALIFVGKGQDDSIDEDERQVQGPDDVAPHEDDHARITVAHGARTISDEGQDDEEPSDAEEALAVEEEPPTKVVKKVRAVKRIPRPVPKPVQRQVPKRLVKGPVRKVAQGVRKGAVPAKRPKPLKPMPPKREHHTPKPLAIIAVLILFFAILGVIYVVNPFPTLTVNATVSDPTVSIGEYVTFYGNGTKSNGQITSYTWDFGDKTSPGKGMVVKHIYSKAGTFNATLTVKSDNGLKKSSKVTVRVSQLSILPPAKKLGDIATYGVHGTGFVEGDSLYSIKNPYPQTGPAEIKVENVTIKYNGTMISSVKDIMSAEDGYNVSHNTLHREVVEELKFDATAYSNLGNVPIIIEGTESMKQQVYIDLKMNQSVKTVISSTAQTKPIRVGSLIQLPALNSKDDLRTYPDLGTVDNQVNIEDLFVGKNLDTSDPTTLQGSIEKGQSPNAIIYSWKYDGISNVFKRPAIHLNVTVDSNTMSRLGMSVLYIDIWIANDLPTYVKIHTYFLGGNDTTQYWADNTAEMSAFTAGTTDVSGTCTAAEHYLAIHPLALYGEFNMTPPEGDPNQTSHLFTPHEALIYAEEGSSGFKAYMSTGSPYAIAGNYSEKNGPTWNLTFGKKGSEQGYNIVVTDIGSGDHRVLAKSVSVSAPTVSRDDLLSLVTLSSGEAIFRSDEKIRDEFYVGNNVDYQTTALLLDAQTPYPNLDLTFTSISATEIKYTYTLMKQVPAVGGEKVFSAAVNADNGQVMFVQEHTGNLPYIPFKLP